MFRQSPKGRCCVLNEGSFCWRRQKPTQADSKKGGVYFNNIRRDVYGVHKKNPWTARLYGREGGSGIKAALRTPAVGVCPPA